MARPIVVTIPHRLGRAEAVRRLQNGFSHVRDSLGDKFVVLQDRWVGDHLDFQASLMGQKASGTVDVFDDCARLEIELPWMLGLLANKAKALLQRQGRLMLEKPAPK
jgi:Putative polyhydroxyalkanoic acid system protein (PHA_gran_rgn)